MEGRVRRVGTTIAAIIGIVAIVAACSHGRDAVDSTSTVATTTTDPGTTTSTTATTVVPTTMAPTTTSSMAAPIDGSTGAFMAAAVYQLMTVDNTFDPGGPLPFTTFLIHDRAELAPADVGQPERSRDRPLTPAERSAIEDRLGPVGEVRWIDDPHRYLSPDDNPTIEKSAVIEIHEPVMIGDTAYVAVSMTCGTTCWTSRTYSFTRDPSGRWVMSGPGGPGLVS